MTPTHSKPYFKGIFKVQGKSSHSDVFPQPWCGVSRHWRKGGTDKCIEMARPICPRNKFRVADGQAFQSPGPLQSPQTPVNSPLSNLPSNDPVGSAPFPARIPQNEYTFDQLHSSVLPVQS